MLTRTSTALLDGLKNLSDPSAWQAFDVRYRPLLMAVGRKLGLSIADAEDGPNIGAARWALPAGLMALMSAAGGWLRRRKTNRIALVLLVGATIICPIAVATALQFFHLLATSTSPENLLGPLATDRQFLAASLAGLCVSLALWRATRTAAFAVISCLACVAVASAAFALLGLRHKLAEGHVDTVAGWYLIPGVVLLCVAVTLDLRRRAAAWGSPFYIVGLFLVLTALTLIARFGPTLVWLGAVKPDPASTTQFDYGFMINGVLYFLVAFLADRSISSAWLRWIGNLLFWLAPSHLLVPILHLENHWPIPGTSWTIAELILPLASLSFVFISVPKQMKSCFFSGLLYSAISVQRLTNRHLENRLGWPVSLALCGLIMTLAAWRWPRLFDKRARPPASAERSQIGNSSGK
ncbi:MAG TPA: hypothetical protein VFE47_09975 [Tepidisphaeraceae bacterium]|nr:hypothetical protein [Tepidisphaeraceae bacterium]